MKQKERRYEVLCVEALAFSVELHMGDNELHLTQLSEG